MTPVPKNSIHRSRSAHRLARLAPAILIMLGVTTPVVAEDDAAPPPNPPPVDRPTRDPLLGWSITPGIGVRVVSLDVKEKSTGYTGTLTNDGSFTDPIYVSLDIETPSWMLSEKVGLSVRSHSQSFTITRQQVPSSTAPSGQDYADLGTSVRGYYSYIGPTLFYRTLDGGGDTRYGLGYGYWKAWFKGDIILAPGGAANTSIPPTVIDGAIDGTTGPILFIQGRGKNYLFEIAISRVTFRNADYVTTLSELGMSVGYTLTF